MHTYMMHICMCMCTQRDTHVYRDIRTCTHILYMHTHRDTHAYTHIHAQN